MAAHHEDLSKRTCEVLIGHSQGTLRERLGFEVEDIPW